MPRTGGVYAPPTGTLATSGTTIESAKYNAFVNDLVSDANAARPISAGGTGATTAAQARINLGITSLADPDHDGLLGWDDSAGTTIYYTLGAGLEFNGTEVRATATGLTDGDKGDITVSSSGATWTIDNNAISTAKIANDAVTLAKIADAALSGSDATLITGTAGTNGQFAQWNADGDIVGVAAPSGGVSGSANSRTVVTNTAYQNTQGKAILVVHTCTIANTGTFNIEISPNNSTWYDAVNIYNADITSRVYSGNVVVPNTWYYRVTHGLSSASTIEIY